MLALIIWNILVLMTFKIDNMGLDKIEKLHLLVTYDFAFKCGQDIYIYISIYIIYKWQCIKQCNDKVI